MSAEQAHVRTCDEQQCEPFYTIAFQAREQYVRWASLVDNDAPGLKPRLTYSRTQRSGCIVTVRLRDGWHLTADGADVIRDAARRAGALRTVAS